MSRKNVVVYTLVENQSLAASFNSPVTFIKYLDNASYQINITTTNSIGTFAVQVSNDYEVSEVTGAVSNPGNWVSLDLAGGVPFANAANDDIVINLTLLAFKAMRLAYTSTVAGTGTCDITLTAKQIGG
jgi:hypothetical protein